MLILFGCFVFLITIASVESKEQASLINSSHGVAETNTEKQANFFDFQNEMDQDFRVTVASQQHDIKQLIKTAASQQQDIDKLKNLVALQQMDIKELDSIVVSQQEDIAALKTTVALQEQETANLKGKLTLQQQFTVSKDTPLPWYNDEEKPINSQVTAEIKNWNKRFVLDTLETVAFEATIAAAKYVEHTHIHDRIIFEDVSLNVGNGYHPGNGTFVAPVGGIYIFSTSVMMHGANTQDLNMHIILEKNGAEIAGAFAYNQGAYEHSSVSAAMDLQRGDSVFVSVERHDDITFYGDRLTSFMGFLLFPY